jgi:Na+-driven multidrug efflux pump
VGLATDFVRAFAVSMVFIGLYFPLSGALRGAGDTRTPFYAGLLGSYGFLLGTSYLLAVPLGLGLAGVYVGIVLSWASRAVVVGWVVRRGAWIDLAEDLIAERAASEEG